MSAPVAERPRRTPLGTVGYLARRAVAMEIGVWQSLYRFVFRRPVVPPGASAFGYTRPVLQVLLVFIVLSAVEIPVLDLVVHRWPLVRIPLLLLGIWGLTFMIGILLGYLTRPHAVGPEGIRVRQGTEIDIPVGWDDVDFVKLAKAVAEPKTPRLTAGPDGTELALRIGDETNIEIRLRRPIEARLPQGTEAVTTVRLHADDPAGFLDAVRTHL